MNDIQTIAWRSKYACSISMRLTVLHNFDKLQKNAKKLYAVSRKTDFRVRLTNMELLCHLPCVTIA